MCGAATLIGGHEQLKGFRKAVGSGRDVVNPQAHERAALERIREAKRCAEVSKQALGLCGLGDSPLVVEVELGRDPQHVR